jgi:uncharacterized protein YbgA (DUF1722 family)/uncharacterized protein YbbK (DUF523 family)
MTAARSSVRVGISSCLLGEPVRFDGGHKRDRFLTDIFGKFVEWVPVCPEIECGLGTPREPIRLVREGRRIALRTVKTNTDLTERMDAFAQQRTTMLVAEELSGYVLKKDSPSCGLERVKLYDRNGVAERSGRGVFATALVERFPDLPIEEEGRLSDPKLRENFIERVFAYSRLRRLFAAHWTLGALVRFHTAHKLMLMAHSPEAYRRLGRLTAGASALPRKEFAERYTAGFMSALAALATRRRHTNVLQHALGYFKKQLDRASKAELLDAIDDYRRGLVPLVAPVTLLRHHVRVHHVDYLAGQLYLDPYPKELMSTAACKPPR